MSVTTVPVIYDHASKHVLRWFVLDFERQLSDPAFQPANSGERMLRVPMGIYQSFGRSLDGLPALVDIQNYVNTCAP